MALDLSGTSVPPPPRGARTGARTSGGSTAGRKSSADREQEILSDKRKERVDAITGIAQLGAFGCVIMRQFADAGAINMYAQPTALELAKLAERKEPIAKAVDSLSDVGPYAGLITVLMPFALQILANHKILKAENLTTYGVKAPETLEAEVRADMARQAMQAMQEQREAEEEMRIMRQQAEQWEKEDAQEKANASMGATAS